MIERHLQTCRGERFHGDFAGRGRTTFCPSCLLEDARPDGPSRGRRVGRLAWLFSPVRTCAVHRIPLVRFPNASGSGRFQDMDTVAPADAELEALAASAFAREVSPLQAYVEARLEGAAGPAWLDGQRIDQAAIASEMVGACMLHGVRFARRALTRGPVGRGGGRGVRGDLARRGGAVRGLRGDVPEVPGAAGRGGPQAIYGRLYAWVRVPKKAAAMRPDPGRPARVHSRPHGNRARSARIPADTLLRRRRHSVASLAREKGMNPKTLNRALVLTGLMPEGDPDRVDGHPQRRGAGGRASGRPARRRDFGRADPRASRLHPDASRAAGARWIYRADRREGRVGRDDVEHGGEGGCRRLPRPVPRDGRAGGESPGRACGHVIDAAKVAKRKVIDVVRLVLDGDLARVELLDEDLRLKSVLVDPDEVGRVLDAREARGRVPIRGAAARLATRERRRAGPVTERGRDGRPYLRAFVKGDPMSTETWWFDPLDLDEFAAGHVDLAALAEERGISANALRRHLNDAGIEPILPWERLEKLVYRRADL